ncbi:tyrosine-type recombinase/integrase [Quadrisphaera sp. INWT6]|uniref:tyrosine-type recombinase/integrase n=1 Tax=Quadrisphaera sp. INWT6 TaxID=2596917 RepID=UPI0018927DA3|nr:tyrosine-type recombinase/integrase [Quadrisphaera sp. INWT6]MBF5083098.1 site-specific integrase [Quadrisphaera sp. INWT6]
MKHGSVYQRHSRTCPPAVDGERPAHRCRGSWAYALEHGRDSNGKRLQTTKGGFPTRAAAQKALQEVAHVLMTDVHVTGVTVADYLSTWLTGKHALRPKTMALYEDVIRHYLVPGLGTVRLLDLRAHHLDRFYAATTVGRRGTPLSPSTIRRIHAVLRSALNTAVKRRLIPYNPADHIELAPENPKRPRPWTADQSRRFLAHVSDDRLSALYRLLIATGMRRGEAIGLRWEDVDLDSAVLVVVQQITEVRGRSVVGAPKTRRSSRLVSLDRATVAALRHHAARQAEEQRVWGDAWEGTGLVFTRENGSALRPEFVTRRFQALAEQAGLPVIRLHDLRHTSASLALRAGVPLKVVSERLGHSQTAITADLYTHVEEQVSRDAARRIAGVLDSPGAPPRPPGTGPPDPDAPSSS